MPRSNRTSFAVIVLLLTALACGFPGMTLPDPNAISTSAALTVIAALTQPAQPTIWFPVSATPVAATLTALPTSTFTSPSETPTSTSTLTSTLTATQAFTATPTIVWVSVSVPTNCRSGPGKIYDYRGALLVGEFAEVFARDPGGQYWYIRNPDVKDRFCWLWGEYATLSGNTSALPIYTPLPTPTPTFTPTPMSIFDASYSGLDTCSGGWWVEFKLKNKGSVSYKSIVITVKDLVTQTTISKSSDGFSNFNGCGAGPTQKTLAPGKSLIVSAPSFAYNPSGHKLRTTIMLCSKTGQNGVCVTRQIAFTP